MIIGRARSAEPEPAGCAEPEPFTAASVPAVSFATFVQPEARSPGVSRVNTYADPLPVPLSSFPCAPITSVLPSIETLMPNQSFAAPSSASSFVRCMT